MSDTNPLLNNDSVQGAAKSIEGILDTKGVIKKPQQEAEPVEKQEPEAKAEDNQISQQQTETQPEPQEQEVAEPQASEDLNAVEEQDTNLYQVTVNGEKIDVNLDELKAGYQKDADYRRKTEELAFEKREVKSEKDRLEKSIQPRWMI